MIAEAEHNYNRKVAQNFLNSLKILEAMKIRYGTHKWVALRDKHNTKLLIKN